MTRPEIDGTATVLIMAGSETTASFLSGATYYILSDTELHGNLKREVREVYQSEEELENAGNRELPLLDCVIKESLRMYPPSPSTLPRRTRSEGDIIDGQFVPGNVSDRFSRLTGSFLLARLSNMRYANSSQGFCRRKPLVCFPCTLKLD